jgi:hypothetical protein
MVVGYTTSLVSLDIPANIAFLERTCCLLKIPTTRALYKPALLMHNTTLEICPLTLGSGLDLMSVWLQGKSQFNFFQIQLTILARGFCISLSLPDIGYVSPRNRNHQFMAPPPIPSIAQRCPAWLLLASETEAALAGSSTDPVQDMIPDCALSGLGRTLLLPSWFRRSHWIS